MFGFEKIQKLLGIGSIMGIDIGTASIKAAVVSKEGDKPKLLDYGILTNYGHFNRANDVLQTSTMKIFDKEVVRLLKFLTKKLKVSGRGVVASLPSFAAFTVLVEMPDIPDNEIQNSIEYTARQYIPLPISEVTIDWLPIGTREVDGKLKKQILLISVPTEKIRQYKEIFKAANLDLVALEVESLSMVRAISGFDPVSTLIIDMGSHSTNIIVTQDGFLKSSVQIDYAANHLTQSLAKGLNVNLKRAEDLKKQKGLLGTGGEFELSTIMMPFVDVIIKEATRAKDGFEENYGAKIERVVLTGGGSNLLGLSEYVSKQIGLVTVKANPLINFKYSDQLELITQEVGPIISVALGLGLREV